MTPRKVLPDLSTDRLMDTSPLLLCNVFVSVTAMLLRVLVIEMVFIERCKSRARVNPIGGCLKHSFWRFRRVAYRTRLFDLTSRLPSTGVYC